MNRVHAPLEAINSLADGHNSVRMATDFRRSVPSGSLISCADQNGPHAYLVESGIVAVYVLSGRASQTCVALAGPGTLLEPEVGIEVCYRALGPVTLFRVPIAMIEEEFRRRPALRTLYCAQLRERLVQAELLANCNARHPILARCSRWLLRLHGHFGETIPVTHAFLASSLGVRRAGVSVSLERLQEQNAICQRHGQVGIVDPTRLLEHACNCRGAPLRSEHPIIAHTVETSIDIFRPEHPRPAYGVAALLAQSRDAIEASLRQLEVHRRLRGDRNFVQHRTLMKSVAV